MKIFVTFLIAALMGCGGEIQSESESIPEGFSLSAKKGRADLITFTPDKVDGLILAFHGLTETAQKMADYSQLQGVAEATNHMLVYMNAGGTTHWKRKPGSPHEKQVLDLWASLDQRYKFKTLYLVGFSDGAIFSHFLANSGNLPVTGIIPYAGGIGVLRKNRVQAAQTPYKVLVLQNRNDKINKAKFSEEIYEEYLVAEYDVTYLNHGWGSKRFGHWWDQAYNQDIYDFIRK